MKPNRNLNLIHAVAQTSASPASLSKTITALNKAALYFFLGVGLLASPFARAITYSDGDVLLIFRADSKNNVEFNLGNVGQFLNQSNGYTVAVTNWNLSIVTNTYALTNGNVQFAVIASSNSSGTGTSWVSDSQPLTTVKDLSANLSDELYSTIDGVGVGAASDTLQAEAPPGTNYINVNPSGLSEQFSFDYIASNNGQTAALLPFLKGFLSFKVTGVTPTRLLFYELDSSSAPQPAATLIGSFTLSSNGALTFQAGPLLDATLITSITTAGGISTVRFAPQTAVKYRLLYSPQLTTSRSNWTVIGKSVAGNGTATTNLTDSSATDPSRFYSVQSYQ